MKLTLQQDKSHVSSDTVCEFENCILKDSSVKPSVYFGKILEKLTWTLSKFIPRSVFPMIYSKDDYFAVLMGVNFKKTLPYFLKAKTRSIYLFDAWEDSHGKLVHYIDKFHINNIFFSSLEAKRLFCKRTTNCRSFWIPEAIDPNQYKAFKFENKDIDVLQIGRKYDWYHQQIANPLRSAKKNIYMREKKEK